MLKEERDLRNARSRMGEETVPTPSMSTHSNGNDEDEEVDGRIMLKVTQRRVEENSKSVSVSCCVGLRGWKHTFGHALIMERRLSLAFQLMEAVAILQTARTWGSSRTLSILGLSTHSAGKRTTYCSFPEATLMACSSFSYSPSCLSHRSIEFPSMFYC